MSKALNHMQIAFCNEYIVDMNATQAAIRAGYSKDSAKTQGSQLLSHQDIKEKIDSLLHMRAERTGITADYVLSTIRTVVERCLQAEPVMEFDPVAKEMVNTGEWQFDSKGVLKGAELLARNLKLLTDKVEHSGHVGFAETLKKARERVKKKDKE